MVYGLELWSMRVKDEQKVSACKMKYMSNLVCISKLDRISNSVMRQLTIRDKDDMNSW